MRSARLSAATKHLSQSTSGRSAMRHLLRWLDDDELALGYHDQEAVLTLLISAWAGYAEPTCELMRDALAAGGPSDRLEPQRQATNRPGRGGIYRREREMTIRYYVEFQGDPGGVQAASYVKTFGGSVRSTVRNFGGAHDVALIDVPDRQRDAMEEALRADENVTIYFTSGTPVVAWARPWS